MPYARRRSRLSRMRRRRGYRARRRARNRYRRGNFRSTTVMRGPFPFGTRYKTVLKYSSFDNKSITGGLVNTHAFRLNSLYDVDYTYAGHQPYGYDTLASIFNKYQVTAIKMKFKMMTNGNVPAQVVFTPYNNVYAPFTNIDLARESPLARTTMTDGQNAKSFSIKYIPRKICGASAVTYYGDVERYAGNNNANPVEAIFLNVSTQPTANCAFTLYYTFKIYCIWFDPLELASS